MALAQLFRRSCTECGTYDIRWLFITDLREKIGFEGSQRIDELEEWGGNLDYSDAWLCNLCGCWGVFL